MACLGPALACSPVVLLGTLLGTPHRHSGATHASNVKDAVLRTRTVLAGAGCPGSDTINSIDGFRDPVQASVNLEASSIVIQWSASLVHCLFCFFNPVQQLFPPLFNSESLLPVLRLSPFHCSFLSWLRVALPICNQEIWTSYIIALNSWTPG